MHKHYLIGTLLFLLSTLAPHRGQAQYDPTHMYQILHNDSQLSLQTGGVPPAPRGVSPSYVGEEFILGTYTGQGTQHWLIVDLGQGLYGLKQYGTGLFVMPGGSGSQVYWAQAFAPVQATFDPNEAGQKWYIRNNVTSPNSSLRTITNFKTGLSLSRQASTFNSSPDPNAPIPIKLGQNVDFEASPTGWTIVDRGVATGGRRSLLGDVPSPPVTLVTLDRTTNLSADKERQSTVAIYPNPAQDRLTILGASPTTVTAVSVTDMSGKVAPARYRGNGTVDVSRLAPGVYIINISEEAREHHKKFVKN